MTKKAAQALYDAASYGIDGWQEVLDTVPERVSENRKLEEAISYARKAMRIIYRRYIEREPRNARQAPRPGAGEAYLNLKNPRRDD